MSKENNTMILDVRSHENMTNIILSLIDEGYTVTVNKMHKEWPRYGTDHYEINFVDNRTKEEEE